MTEQEFLTKYSGDGSSGRGTTSSSQTGSTDTTRGRRKNGALRQEYLKKQENLNGYKDAISAAEERGDTLSALYGQYQLDVSNVLNSYNDRKTRGGYKSDAQDFYDRTMAKTTAARDSIFKLTEWMKENRASIGDDIYSSLMDEIRENSTSLSEIQKAAYDDIDFYGQFKDADDYNMWQAAVDSAKKDPTRGRGNESGLRNKWIDEHGVRVAPWQPSKSELETWTEDYVKANQELKDAQKALKKITPTEGMTLDDAQREYGTARIAAQQRVDDAQDKLDELGAKLEKYGGAVPKTELSAKDWFNAVRYGFRSGITSADQAIAKGLDFFLGDALGELQTLGGETVRLFNPDFDYNEKNLLDRYVDWSQSHLDVQRERAAEAVGINRTAQKVNQYTEMVFNSLPMSVMAIMSGGATAAPQASTEALQIASAIANSGKAQQLLTPVLNAVKNMANDPNWQFTFMSTVGESYEDALADGASNEDAVINALLNAAANATIEVGGGDEALGGLQKLPKPLREALQRGDKSGVLQILKSIPSEAGEEIMQGIAEAGIKGIYKDVPLFSMNDEGAVISPSRMLDEAKGAAVVSAVLGGGQYAAEAGLNAAERSRANKEADAVAKQLYGDSADTLVQQGLESPVDSKSYKLARQYQTILDNNGELSGKQIRKLVQANSEQIRTEGETEAQAQTGAGKEAAQQTAPQTQSTPPAQTNTETGAQTTAQQTRSTGAMEAIYKGQVGNVVSLTKTDKGWAATIEQPNGKRSNVMEWQAVFDPDTQGILDAFRPSAYADEMLKTYALTDEQVEPKTYALAFNTVADIYGKSTSLTKQQAQEASRRDGGAAAILTDEQFSRAFDAGRNSKDSSIQNSVTRKSSKGAVGFKGVQYQGMTYRAATKDMVSDAELSVLKTMSKAVGVDMVLYQSEEQNGEYQGANGFYRNGTVYLDVHAGATKTTEQSAILLTAAHELTHYLRENNAEAYTELQDFVMQHLIESGTDIETLAKKKVDKERGLISMEDAAEEVIADSCEMMLENTQVPQMMAKENPGLFAQIREWLAEFAAKLRRAFEGVQARSAEAQAMMQYAEELQQMWDNALAGAAQNTRNNTQNARNNAQAAANNGTTAANNGTTAANNGTTAANNGTKSGKSKRSIREIGDTGMRYVKADRQVLFGNDPREWGEQLTKYINKEIRKGNDVLLTAPDGEIIKLTATTAEKGAFRNIWYDTKGTPHLLTDAEYEAKLNAEAHIDELVQVSEDRRKGRPNAPDDNGIHGSFAKDGWRYRGAYFMDHDGKYYEVTISVAYGANGKVAYNIAEIKKRSFPEKNGSSNPKTGAQGKTSLDARISQPTGEVKGKSSMRERDEDLQKKYPKLNLNEDISELDGVPAVELTDGSVLPILDRDRYPTHVSFIEGNRIDVDDLRSGGWIGDGVYDPSFTSDTARYIERKQAGKRVAELRGVPFNQFEDDGKSSMRDNTTDDTAAERKGRQESYANLRAENAKLREQLDYWKGQTKRTKEKTVRKTDADAYAKRLTEQLHNPKAREQVADEIKRMGDYIVQTPGSELSYTEVKDWALAIADYVLQDSQTVIDDSQTESLQQLYGYLKDNKLKVTDDTFNDLPEGWVRQHRGRIKLSEDGLDVDTAWGELQEKFGEGMFPSDITAQADMLMHIADTIEAMKPTYGNPFAGYMGEMREAVAQDILDTVLSDEIRQTAMTAADRAQARLDKRIAQDTARYNALRDEKNARIEQVYQEGVARRQEAVAKEKAAKWAKVAETKQYYQNMAQQAAERRRESADIKKYRDRVAATAEQLSDWLLKNSDKEHVPEALKQVVGEFLSTIDFSSKSRLQGGENTYNDRKFLQRLDKLEQMLRNQRDYLNSADNENAREDTLDMYLDLPAEILDELRDIRSEVTRLTTRDGGYTINQMPAGELRRLDAVLTAISHSIRKANTLFSNAQYNSVQQVAQTTIVEMDKLGAQTKETTGAGRFFQWDNATPYYAFKKLGAGARSIFKGLMQGWDKMAFNSKEIIDFTNKLYTAKEAREWQEKVHNVRIGNNTVQITTAQLMSLHCLVKRTQAMQHIMGGGFKVSVIKQSGIGKDNIAQTKQYKPTLEELAMLDGLLTNRQRKVADELQKFMVDVCGEWGNEVSMKRFGYRAFGEENYFPIVSDANVLKAVDPEAKANDMFRLLNMSATKSLNVKANNALVVSDIFEVFTNHSADMAKYNALALPLLDAIKWYNYKESTKTASGRVFTNTVQLSLETAYGNAAKAYITKFIKDLNGVREGGKSQSDKRAKRMVSRYKAAAVGANIRVAIQQPTAYVRAAMAIDPKYLAAALKPGGHKASTAEMEKYSGIATWKGLGFVSTDIGRSMRSQIMHTESWVDSVTDKTMILAEKGDSVTWSALWRACKLETKDRTGLHGEELNKATADRFQEVIYQTQVVDATMTRSQAMRSQGTMDAITTSFMAEPTLSYNLVMDAYAEYQAEARRTGNKAAALQHIKGKLAKTIAIYAASGAATLIASSFWDAWRDDDDYETFLQKWAQAFFGEAEDKWYEKPLLQELFLLNKLPGVKDIISIITGDDVNRMDLEGAKNLWKAWRIMSECLKLATGKLEEQDAQYGNMTGYGKLANILKGISQVTGLPLYNATRDVVAVWNTLLSNVTGVKLAVYKPNSKREIKNAYVNGLMTDEQAMDELVKQGAADDADQAFWIINDWNGDGSSSDKMSEIYDAVRAGDTGTYDALVKELTDHGVFETKIQNDVKNQIRDWYQGGDTTQATISKQDALDLLQKYGGKAEKAADTLVEQWTCEKVTGISYWNIGDEYINGNISEARALELQAKYGYGDVTKQMPAEIASNKESAHDKLMQWKLEKETGISAGGDSFTGIREAYNAGKISKQEVYDYRIKYAGDTPEQAANTAYRYEWIGGDTRMNSVTGNQAHRYDDYVAASGMSKIDYWNAIDGHGASSFPADLVEGSKTRYVKNSKRDKIWDYVDSLNLTPRQKDALATAYAYDVNADVKSTSAYFDFEDAPWNN
jgi:hypothetical protein